MKYIPVLFYLLVVWLVLEWKASGRADTFPQWVREEARWHFVIKWR